jgi:hypothetical protein
MVAIAKYSRRGVLLLVVLSVLTLFLMLGATYLAVATRARKASRAFAENVVAATNARATEARLLDEVFLTVARGTTLSLTTGTSLANGDDLLGDKYGTNSLLGLTGSAAVFQSSPAFIQVSVSGMLRPATGSTTSGSNVSDLVGRVVTLNLPGLAASTRIVSATGSITSPTLVIPAGPTPAGAVISVTKISSGTAAVSGTSATTLIINGREFDGTSTNEPYDGFDSRNPLLTRIIGNTSGPPTVAAAPLTGTTSLDVDNDGDGVGDSAWIDLNLPPIIDASGRSLRPQASILVVDLDGRLNVNAHGSTVDAESFDPAISQNKYPTYTTGSTRPSVPLYQLPRGMASGPATISLSRSLLFSGTTNEQAVLEGGLKIFGGQQAKQRRPDSVTSREVPALRNTEGRYADGAWTGSFTSIGQPGVSGSNDRISLESDRWRATLSGDVAQNYFVDPGRFGSPWDVKGRMKLWVDGFGQPVYYKPSWGTGGGENDVVDDPYEINLTRSGARTGYTAAPSAHSIPSDNLYTSAELEGLLRYNDPDSLKLPRRLVALNEDQAGRNRLLLTTESWDTPAITGTSWQATIGTRFAALLTSATATAPRRARDLFGPELVMGHKLDLNRPFHDAPNIDEPNDATGTARRQAFAKQLYCLMTAVAQQNGLSVTGTTARQIAQYAINVVDYRDGDSVMTKFEYDPAFSGTNTTWITGSTNYVWGCERPELLITETLAWHNRRTDDLDQAGKVAHRSQEPADNDFDQRYRPWGAFFVELYSPWQSTVASYSSGTVALEAVPYGVQARGEPVPKELINAGSQGFSPNVGVAIRKTNATGFPLWRLASVRGEVEGGTGFSASKAIIDPSSPSLTGTAAVDRVFYFAQPPSSLISGTDALRNGAPGAVFWSSGTTTPPTPSQAQFIVVGTAELQLNPKANPIATGSNPHIHVEFDRSKNNAFTPATLSERINTTGTANLDPYELLARRRGNATAAFTVSGTGGSLQSHSLQSQLATPTDEPLDGVRNGGAADEYAELSSPFLLKRTATLNADLDPDAESKPVLLFNGTHENFAVIHLQRLANPDAAWDAIDNPYVTVDSMPVDLTVVNTSNGALASNLDEPGTTPGLTDAGGKFTLDADGRPTPDMMAPAGNEPLTWLRKQKQFGSKSDVDFSSTERSGKPWDGSEPNVPESDVWSRRVRVDKPLTSGRPLLPLLNDNDSLRTVPIVFRVATSPEADNTKTPPELSLDAAPHPNLDRDTFKKAINETAIPSRWARGEFDANNDGVVDPSEDGNSNGLFDPPRYAWLAWPNRPFSSVVDLALVPTTSPFDLTGKHSIRTTGTDSSDFYHLPNFFEDSPPSEPWLSLAGRTGTNAVSLFDFVHIPSPFAGVYATVPRTTGTVSNANALDSLGFNVYPLNTISSFREPGKVNINTLTDRRVWRALFGDVNVRGTISGSTSVPGTDDPIAPTPDLRDRLPGWSATLFAQPETTGTANSATRATSLFDFFRNMADRGYDTRPSTPRTGGFVDSFINEDINANGVLDSNEDKNDNGHIDLNYHRDTDRNAYFRYQTMRQLSNVVTTRSNVYAVWVTIRYLDPAGQEVQPYRRSRAFYIFDRSIPVAYERGEDHNVRDAILLRRIIQ